MKIIKFLLLTFATLLVGCTTQTGRHETIERAKQLMNEHPDSALALLDSLQPYQGAFSKSMRMDFMMQRLNAQNKCDTIFRSDSIAKILVDYYSHHGTSNQRMLANYLAGRVYYDMGELPYALQFYQDATEAADTTRSDCDYATLLRVHSQMGELFKKQFLLDNSLNEYSKAAEYALRCNDTLHYIIHLNLQGNVYGLMGKEDSALIIKENAAEMLRKQEYEEYAAQSLGSGAAFLIEQGNMTKAKQYIDLYRTKSGLFQADGNIKTGYENYYYTIGLYFLKEQKLDSAEYYFRKLLNTSAAYNDQLCAAQGLCKLYKLLHKADSVAKYAEYSYNVNDSTYNHANASNLLQMQAMYDYSRHQKMAEKERVEAEKAKSGKLALWTALIGLAAFVAALSFESFRRRKEAERRYQRLLLRYERMEADVNSRQQEDAADIKETAIYKHLMDLLAEEPDKNIALGKDDWQELETEVDKFHPQFRKTLESYYHLSDVEYHISLLTKLNIEPSKICRLVNRSKQTVSTTRTRLFTKVFGRKGNPADWDQFIDSL